MLLELWLELRPLAELETEDSLEPPGPPAIDWMLFMVFDMEGAMVVPACMIKEVDVLGSLLCDTMD